MQVTGGRKFNPKHVEETLKTENKYITNLLSILSLPTRMDEIEEEGESFAKPVQNGVKRDTTRAKSLTELQARLKEITSKKKLTYKEKLVKKTLKKRCKKKTKQDERNAQEKIKRGEKLNVGELINKTTHIAKPIFNSEGKMVFSKFDFTNLGQNKEKKEEKDPKKILNNLQKQREKLNMLQSSGKLGEAIEIQEKNAWRNALAKVQGKKVKDDPELLKKSVKRQEQKKKTSQKKWEKRRENVEKGMRERLDKRNANIEKRKKEKKVTKMKKAVKKGKIIAGF